MRVLATFLIAFIQFALFTNAAVSNIKHAISGPVQMCINDISAVNIQLTSVKDTINRFDSIRGLTGLTSIISKKKVLEDKLKMATTDCCAVTTVTDKEATAAFKMVDVLASNVDSAIASIFEQKSLLNYIPLTATIYETAITEVSEHAEALIKCLLERTPIGSKIRAEGYASQVNAAIAKAKENVSFFSR